MTSDDLIGVDTNLLIYAELLLLNVEDARSTPADALLSALAEAGRLVIGAQVFAELVRVLERQYGHTRPEAVARATEWRASARFAPIDAAALGSALDLAARHDLRIGDALVVASAAAAGCVLLLAEDLQDGFVWRGMTVANPFAAVRHPLLVSLLG